MGILCFALLLNLFLGGVATRYVVQFWGSYFRKESVNISFIPCAIAGLFCGQFTIPAALLTWILSFALKPNH